VARQACAVGVVCAIVLTMLQQLLRWICFVGVMAVPVVLPFIVSASMFFPYITGKNFTFRIIVGIIFAAWLLLAFLDARYRPRFSWVLSALALFVVAVGVADLFFSVNPFKSFWSNFERMEGYITLLHIFAYFLVASTVLNTQRIWNTFWYSTLGASVVVAFIALKPWYEIFPSFAVPRIDATFGNPIYLAVYSLIHIFIALILMVRWRGTHWHQALLGFVAALHVLTMLFTATRGAVLGFLGGAVVAAVLIALFERERKIIRGFALGALALLLLILGTGFAIKDTEFAKTTPLVNRYTQIDITGGTINARFMNWGMAWEGVKERPIFGWGQGNYEYVFSKHFDPNMYAQEPWFDRTHNIFFDWLVSAGFVGLITYLLIPLALLAHLWVLDPYERKWSLRSLLSVSALRTLMKKHDDDFSATERALWTGLLAAYMFHNLFVFDNIISYIMYASILAYLHWRVTQGHAPLLEKVEVSRETVLAVVAPVVVVASGFAIWYVNWPGMQTSQLVISALVPQRTLPDGTVVRQTPEDMLAAYQRATEIDQLGRQEVREQLAQRASQIVRAEGVSEETKAAFRSLALEQMEQELERNQNSARLWLFYGSMLAQLGDMQKAEEALSRAVELTPTKQTALFQLGEIKMILGKTDEGLELFKKAYELVPRYVDAQMYYAMALIRAGKDKEAVDLLTEHYDTPAVNDDRILRAWIDAQRYDIAVEILEERVAARTEPTSDEEVKSVVQEIVQLAAGYKELGQQEKAVATLQEVIDTYPEYKEQMEAFIQEVRAGE